ncbi:MAG: tetratricopeptide repeat protein [Wolinella sp.]
MHKPSLAHVLFLSLCTIALHATPMQKREAINLYNLGKFSQAKELLLHLTRESPNDSELNFLLGRSALELKEYDLALAAFDRVLLLNPQHARTRLEIARIYFERRNYTLARKEVDSVLAGKLPPSVRENAEAFRRRIVSMSTPHTWGGILMLGIERDDNVNNDIGNKTFILPLYYLPLKGNKKRDDFSFFEGASFVHTYDFGEREGWAMENNLSLFNKNYAKEHKVNLALGSVSTGLSYTEGMHKFIIPLGYDKIFLGGEGYLDTFNTGVRYRRIFSASLLGEAGILAKRSDFVTKYKLRNNDELAFLVGIKIALGSKSHPTILSLNATRRNVYARYDTRTDVGLSERGYRFELSKEVYPFVRVSGSYAYKKTWYKKRDTLFLTERRDHENRWELGATYGFSNSSSFGLNLSFTDHRSNHDPFTYYKSVLNGYYMLSF